MKRWDRDFSARDRLIAIELAWYARRGVSADSPKSTQITIIEIWPRWPWFSAPANLHVAESEERGEEETGEKKTWHTIPTNIVMADSDRYLTVKAWRSADPKRSETNGRRRERDERQRDHRRIPRWEVCRILVNSNQRDWYFHFGMMQW